MRSHSTFAIAILALLLPHLGFSQRLSNTNYALEFDGNDDLVEIKDTNGSLDLNDFTLEAWVIRREENSTGVIIHKGAGGEDPSTNTNFALFFRGDNVAHALWEHPDSRNEELVGTTVIESNQWYHIAGVRSATDNTLRLYVNGELDAQTVTSEGAPNIQNIPVRFGFNDVGFPADEHFKGIIDDVRIWNIPRTQTEIRATMYSTLAGTEQGLVGYWRLDEGEGQAVNDLSPLGNHGSLGVNSAIETTDPEWIAFEPPAEPGAGDYALSFDGSDDFVLVPDLNNSLDLTAFTLECWVQIKATGKIHELIVKDAFGEEPSVNSNYSFDVWSDQKLRIVFENENQDNQEIFGETPLEVGKFYHVAATFNAQTHALSLYLNGVLEAGPVVVNGNPNRQNQPLRIGTGYEGGPRTTTHGIIDEVRIWNIAKTQTQIQANMYTSLQGNEPGLVGYWRFDEGEGQAVHDASPFGNHGQRGHSPSADAADPVWVLANRNNGNGSCGIPLPAAEAYGNLPGGDQTHADKVDYCFEGQPGALYLTFEAYDIDLQTEVKVRLNGESIFDLPITSNNAWSGLTGVLLPDELINDSGPNQLSFDNLKNPPKNWRWGVRQVSVDPFYALPSAAAFGRIRDGDQSHPDKVVYFFSGQPGDLDLTYAVYDIDNIHEIDILLNGVKIHDEAVTANEAWSEQRTLLLPDGLVNDTGINVLIFNNTKNPPKNWIWGVRNVSVSLAQAATLALNLSQGLSFSGVALQHASNLFDGQTRPPARPEGDDDGAADSTLAGVATIGPEGYLIVDYAAPQQFDAVMIYPEWNAQRYFRYRIEASLDGQNWQTLIDRTAAAMQGTQFVPLPQTLARFMRLSGASSFVDEAFLPAGVNEQEYWQAHDALIENAAPQELALAELALLRQEKILHVDAHTEALPAGFRLAQNYPNPFNPSTTIRFDLPQREQVKLAVYNTMGELVQILTEGSLPAGTHIFTFEAAGLASGVYLYRLQAGAFSETRKLLLMR
ncbi:T9SS type A sorting domain-containing protein [bacterium]|nr:T9SS type A sorting domain-containing protein [bacterium]